MALLITGLGVLLIVGGVLLACGNGEPETKRLLRKAQRDLAKRPRVR